MSSRKLYTPAPSRAIPATQGANLTTEQIILNAITGQPLLLTIPSDSQIEGQAWDMEWSGRFVTGATMTATFKLYYGNSATPGSNTLLGTTGAVNQNSATSPFILRARNCIFDSVSGKLEGIFEALVNGTIVAAAAFSTILTGLNGQNDPVVSFCLSLQLSVANAANQVVVTNAEVAF